MTDLLLKIFVKDYENVEDPIVKKRYGLLASFFGWISNFILFLGKIITGSLLGLFSIITDSVNNLSDFGMNVLSIIGVKMASKPADKDHPFGHQRVDHILALIIGCVVMFLGVALLCQGVSELVEFIFYYLDNGTFKTREISEVMFIVSTVILSLSILIKILQSMLYKSLGKRINSLQLKALSKDSLNDVIATSAVLIGLIVTRFTRADIDCFFTVIVSIFVLVSGFGIAREAISILIGQKPDDQLVDKLINLCKNNKDVLGIHDLKLHYYGGAIYGVLHVELDGKLSVTQAHEICDAIERETYQELHIDLTIHMDPVENDDPFNLDCRQRVMKVLNGYEPALKMHDFQTHKSEDGIRIRMDVDLPKKWNNDAFKAEFEKKVEEVLRNCEAENLLLNITYDDLDSDCLSGTAAER